MSKSNHSSNSHRRRSLSGDSGDRNPKSRDPSLLPESFGRVELESLVVDDELSVLQRMGSAFKGSPLHSLYECIEKGIRIKVWTRTYNGVRGVLCGNIIAFDKHWNLIMQDCTDVFLKPKKSKTPFLRNVATNEALPDIPAKVMKKKLVNGEKKLVNGEKAAAGPPKAGGNEGKKSGGKEREKRGKKEKKILVRKTARKIFVRGDSVIMVCPEVEKGDSSSEEEQ